MINTREELLNYLYDKAKEIRIRGLELISKGALGHPGATLSSTELFAALYFYELKIDPKNPKWDLRDRFVLSKGHGCPPYYVALAMRGYYPWDELIDTYGSIHSRFQGHPDMKKTPGVDMTAGSLGQGLSVAVGMAYAAKADEKTHRIFCMMGDGECDEGQIWEAAMAASHFKLDNLIGIVDQNRIQAKGPTNKIMDLEPFGDKWRAFGWNVLELDGHNMAQILDAFHLASRVVPGGKPTVLIAHTIKGRGVSFMENTSKWHTHAPSPEQLEQAVAELEREEGYKWI